jgi:hypothetical protein
MLTYSFFSIDWIVVKPLINDIMVVHYVLLYGKLLQHNNVPKNNYTHVIIYVYYVETNDSLVLSPKINV